MKKVRVALPGREYDIMTGAGLLAEAGQELAPLAGGQPVAVVSDENVWRLYGAAFEKAMAKAGASVAPVVVPPGEGSKSLQGLGRLYTAFAEIGLNRGGLVAAFGGGVVGDVAGFAAATYMRGVPFVQLPTTLLAMVDSSVGGKTAINLPQGKNMAGVFYQPVRVLADTDLLQTLPDVEFAGGMAEVIKYGAICSRPLFDRLAATPGRQALEAETVIAQCCDIKADIVLRDEEDHDERMVLNFGHSFGHAIEALGGYAQFSHGQAVAMGMVLAAKVGRLLGVTPAGCAEELETVLEAFGLPTQSPWPAQQLLGHMLRDKKNTGGKVRLVLLEELGRALVLAVEKEQLETLLLEVDRWER